MSEFWCDIFATDGTNVAGLAELLNVRRECGDRETMAKFEVLNSDMHRNLRLRSQAGPAPHFVPIVVSEFATAAASCPILLAKNPENGRFYVGALFGFSPGENLVSVDPGSSRAFRPLDVERQGFFTSDENIAIDIENPRISETDGDPLFEGNGEPTDALRRIQRALGLLVTGNQETERFIETLVGLRLIEPIDVSLTFDDGEKLRLDGVYTVSLDSISELNDADALSLFRKGYLQLAYAIAGSLRQLPVLANRRNDRLSAG